MGRGSQDCPAIALEHVLAARRAGAANYPPVYEARVRSSNIACWFSEILPSRGLRTYARRRIG